MTTQTSRKIVHDGICSYFGGTYVPDERCWAQGPLMAYGLGAVRKAFPKRLNDADFTYGMVSGRGMGTTMVVNLPADQEVRLDKAGPPVNDGQRNITSGGVKTGLYQVELELFHLSQVDYAEDAVDDFDQVIEAVKQQIRLDRTLGGICTEAGESRLGIRVTTGRPGIDKNNRVGLWARVQFEVRVQMIA